MSKIFTALLLALSLSTVACDEPDDKKIERNDGDEDTSSTGDDDTTGATEVDEPAGTTGDDEGPGCLNNHLLPPTGGPAGTIGDDC